MSHVAMSLRSFALITAVINVDSVLTDGLDTYSLDIHCRCGFPFAQGLPFNLQSLFCVIKINDSKARFFSSAVSVFQSIGAKHIQSCSSCFISSNPAFHPCCPNFFIACCRL
jgi:hypothetical protein